MFIDVDFTSRIAALRSVGLALGVPNASLPDSNASNSDISCLRWINIQRAFKSAPLLPGLDYNGFVKAINDLAGLTGGATSVWNASDAATNDMIISNGGLTISTFQINYQSVRGTKSQTSGKFYVEFLSGYTAAGPNDPIFGLADANFVPTDYLGTTATSIGLLTGPDNVNIGNPTAGFTSNYSTGIYAQINDIWALAVDLTAGKIWLSQNNVWFGSGAPATGANPMATFTGGYAGKAYFPAITLRNATYQPIWTLQPTAISQKYVPPVGFSAWN